MKIRNCRPHLFMFIVRFVLLIYLSSGISSLALANPGTWSVTGSSNAARINHTSTRLPNGKVLLTGPNSSAELYDQDTGTFTATGVMNEARFNATATLLKNGKVLIAGGGAPFTGNPLATAEIFDPDTGLFTAIAGTLQSARYFHTATLLADGKVLIAGGFGFNGNAGNALVLGTAELFDPATETFSAIPNMLNARYGHSATLLKDGKVLIAGGRDTNNMVGVLEIFDPSSAPQPFRLPGGGGAMANDRADHTATLLPDGKVLIAGGWSGTSFLNTAEIYDPAMESSALLVAQFLADARANHTATLLPDGKVLLTGGQSESAFVNTAELFDFTTQTFTTTGSMIEQRVWHTATLLLNGKVLVTGGMGVDSNNSSIYLSSAELYCPDSGVVYPAIIPAGTLMRERTGHTATPLLDGTVLIAGGKDSFGQFIEQAELYDPATGDYFPIGSLLPRTRANHTATRLPDGRVLLVGGMNDQFSALSSADIFDPQTSTFSTVGLTAFPRLGHTATLLDDGSVMIIGGDGRNEASVELFENGQFIWTANLQTKRAHHTATYLGDSILIAGGSDSTKQAEVFDLITRLSNFTNPMDSKRSYHTATLLPDGTVLIAGGRNKDESILGTAEIYAPAAQSFTPIDGMSTGRSNHVATPLPNGQVLMVGGDNFFITTDRPELLSSIEIFDPETGHFSFAGFMEAPRTEGLTATLLSNCKVLIAGGGDFLRSELYSPSICGPGICGPNIQGYSTGFTPSGVLFTIHGVNFGENQGDSLVMLNGNTVETVSYWSDASIVFTLPSGVTSGSVSVTVNGSASNAMAFSGICATNVSGGVAIERGGFRYNRTTKRFLQQITLTNASSATIAGPVSLTLDNLTSGVTLVNKSGNTACANPVSPFINVNVDSDNELSPGEKSNVVLEFSVSTKDPINYATRVLSGTPN